MTKDNPIESIKLPVETKRRLEEMGDDITKTEAALVVLKDLGIETITLQEKLDFSKKVRTTLLEKFS